MKPTLPISICLAALCLAAPVQGRIWTLAKDPTRQFEGDVVKVDGDNVTVKLSNGKLIAFKKSAVCEDDRKYLAALPKKEEEPAKAEEKSPKAEEKGKKPEVKPAGDGKSK